MTPPSTRPPGTRTRTATATRTPTSRWSSATRPPGVRRAAADDDCDDADSASFPGAADTPDDGVKDQDCSGADATDTGDTGPADDTGADDTSADDTGADDTSADDRVRTTPPPTTPGFVSPESFSLMESVMVLCMVVLGGMGNIRGVILGGVMLALLPEILRHIIVPMQQSLFGRVIIDPESLRMLLFGTALVAVMLYRPAGLWPSSVRRRELNSDEVAP